MSSTRHRIDAAEVQARLEAIYERFRESFAANLTTLDEASRHLETGALDDAERSAAESAAHRIAGAAETVGFPEATAPARRLEEAFGRAKVHSAKATRLLGDTATLRRILLGKDGRAR
jgi:HPt (histidine-containing phosphotransfer) domain-containing protein